MPLSGRAASCSRTRRSCSAGAAPPGSRRTGKTLVNRPRVPDRSAPGRRFSSRPWPSRAISTESSGPGRPSSRRHTGTASASAVSRTSCTEWAVRSAVRSGPNAVQWWRTVAWVSRAGSSAPAPRAGSGRSDTAVQWASSAVRRSDTASERSARAHSRKVVPGGGSGVPCQAAARSAVRTPQEAASVTRWCRTASSRPSRSGPVSNHRNRATVPAAGSSSAARSSKAPGTRVAIVAWSSDAASVRRTRSAARAVPAGAARRRRVPSSSRVSVERSRSCRSRTVWTVRCSPSRSMPGGVRRKRAWLSVRKVPPWATSRVSMGVSGMSPTPASGSGSVARLRAVPAASASAATVGRSNTSRGERARPAARARPTSRMETMLSPPSAKKLSCTPTESSPRTCANSAASRSSAALRGGWAAGPAVRDGAGSAAVSSFPLRVRGNASTGTNADGTM